ncbi:Endoribonuclease L-PSP/chorismate mutase-like protein [Aspergillus californicus]
MSRQLISSEKFPPKPHNSPATKIPGLVFCAGQTPQEKSKQQQTILQNLKEVLELSGSSLNQVVKYSVYLADMKDFADMNEVNVGFLPQPMPSRSCLQAVPPGAGTVIEIELLRFRFWFRFFL